MGIAQPTLAAMEPRGAEIKVSRLKRYIEAAAGTLNVTVNLSDGQQLELTLLSKVRRDLSNALLQTKLDIVVKTR